MRWFQHHSNAYMDLALREIVSEFGAEGYGFYWMCCELVAQQGKNYAILPKKNWKSALALISTISPEKIEKMLVNFATVGLISEKALKHGTLSVPKMKNYSDNYTKYPQSKCKATAKLLQSNFNKKRIDKNRIEKKRREGKKNLFFNNLPIRKDKNNKLWVVPKDGGAWKEYCGKLEDLEER